MEIATFVEQLKTASLSSKTTIWADPSKADFQDSLARRTDVGKKQPGAIIMPASEDDAAKIVKLAVESSVPFVAKAGGHSAWSTIGSSGFVLDFSLMRAVEVDTGRQTATASAGTLIGDIVDAVAEQGYCRGLHTVDHRGGITVLAPLIGFGSDNIVSARMITAKGDLITVSKDENAELLYAIKAAGQFFGVVTSLTVKIHPLSILGSPEGSVWSASLLFDVSKAADVARAAIEVKKTTTRSYCLTGVMPAPPTLDPIILVLVIHLGSKADGEEAFKPILDLGPLAVPASSEVPFGKVNEGFQAFESKGGFKRWLAVGMTSLDQFQPEDMTRLVDQRGTITEKYPSAKPTGSVIEFTSDGPWNQVTAENETAWSTRDVATWCHLLCWASEEEAVDYAHEIAEESMRHIRRNQPKYQFSIYGNFSRIAPLEQRYKGAERLEKVRGLKLKWDPNGVFTNEFL
ncbi:Uu.00g062340.m01.CDS01 [Anthostomella pinea]|uniref:Uu.00g062340.m01.CDS01 n=1 Tax=Anthostomella pinea TaxID=933095 RepID=A0AAI8YMS5_9PEZI|nr:Uu.00g062340.m01.CDS01 [Anthostomella pinea]